MTISLSTISSIFSPLSSTSSGGGNFLLSQDATDPITDATLALGKSVSQALGNAQINLVLGTSSLAANTAVKRINAQIIAKKQEQADKAKAAIAALSALQHKVDKTA
jgi:hypothetical protein